MTAFQETFLVTAALVAVAGIGLVLFLLYRDFRTLWQPLTVQPYDGRHRGRGRKWWPAEWWLHWQRIQAHAKRTAYLAMLVVPVEEVPDPADVWLDAIRAARPRLGPGAATGTAAYAQLRTDALESTNEQILDLVRHGIRPPSPWGTPVLEDSWETEPALVSAA